MGESQLHPGGRRGGHGLRLSVFTMSGDAQREIRFREKSRFRPWELKRLWVLYGVPVKSVMDMTRSLLDSFVQPEPGGNYIYDDEAHLYERPTGP